MANSTHKFFFCHSISGIFVADASLGIPSIVTHDAPLGEKSPNWARSSDSVAISNANTKYSHQKAGA